MSKQRRSMTYTVIAVIDDDGLWDTDTVTPSDGELTRILESWTSPKAGSFRQILDSQQDTGAARPRTIKHRSNGKIMEDEAVDE